MSKQQRNLIAISKQVSKIIKHSQEFADILAPVEYCTKKDIQDLKYNNLKLQYVKLILSLIKLINKIEIQ